MENQNRETEIQNVSLIALIADPARWDGYKIRVIGFARIEFEGNALYMHREDFEKAIAKNGVWIDAPDSNKVGFKDYAIIEGVFDAQSKGHLRMYSGTIREITRFDQWH